MLNSTEDLYTFVQLSKAEFPQSAAEQCLVRASAIVDAFAPLDDTDRSARMEPIRKIAEINYAASELFSSYGVIFFQDSPPIRVLNILSFGAGSDSPTPTELLSALRHLGDEYRQTADYWLARCKPITATIKAGK
jgi:hypothetical protein